MISRASRQKGFTIVELLVVVVVIAILAAVTIVAFNGVKQRVENTKTQQAVVGYARLLHMYATDNSSYPNVNTCIGSAPCLSSSGSACFGLGTVVSLNLDAYLTPYTNGNFPAPSSQKLSCGGQTYTGVYYRYNTALKVVQFYALFGGGSCPSISGVTHVSSTTNESATLCIYGMPAVS